MRVKREVLLAELESVAPGLSPKAVLEQSDCFVFADGKVSTFNDELFASADCCLDVAGAVKAKPLLDLLARLPDEEIEVSVADGELLVRAKKRRKAGIPMESEVLLPVDGVEKPVDWRELPEGFVEAVGIVSHCAGTDESRFVLTCVHLHPERLEATDNFQIIRYPIETGLGEPTIVRHSSVRHVVGMGAMETAETDNWLFFRNPAGVVLGCRRWVEQYEKLDEFFQMRGKKVTLPQGLDEAVDRAGVFSGDGGPDANRVVVELRQDKARIEGRGMDGWFQEIVQVKYAGPPMKFQIAPAMLKAVMERSSECMVVEGRIKVDGGKYEVVFCTEPVGDDDD